jgi:transcriptional regulator with XRE-family HTH domain
MTAQLRDLFREKVRAHGGSRTSAVLLGCSRSYVDMIIKGDRRPGMRTARAIETLFGIPMQAWVDELPRPRDPADPANIDRAHRLRPQPPAAITGSAGSD